MVSPEDIATGPAAGVRGHPGVAARPNGNALSSAGAALAVRIAAALGYEERADVYRVVSDGSGLRRLTDATGVDGGPGVVPTPAPARASDHPPDGGTISGGPRRSRRATKPG